jgi:hypothetical protein
MRAKRPFSVTILVFGVLSFVLLQLTRMVMGIAQWQFLAELPMSASPLYIVSSGLFWGVIGVTLCIGLWLGRLWAIPATRWSAVIFSIYYWIDQSLIMDNPLRSTNWPFLIAFNLIVLFFIYGFFLLPKVNQFFGEKDERKPQDPRVTR